jgi:hypothetical protein
LGEVLGEVAGVLDGDEPVVLSMQDQRRCLDERQQGPGVGLEGGPQMRWSSRGLVTARRTWWRWGDSNIPVS